MRSYPLDAITRTAGGDKMTPSDLETILIEACFSFWRKDGGIFVPSVTVGQMHKFLQGAIPTTAYKIDPMDNGVLVVLI